MTMHNAAACSTTKALQTEAIQQYSYTALQQYSNTTAKQQQNRNNGSSNKIQKSENSVKMRSQILLELQGLWPIILVVTCDLPIPVSLS